MSLEEGNSTEVGLPQGAEFSPRLLPHLLEVPRLFEERDLIRVPPKAVSSQKTRWPRVRQRAGSRQGAGSGAALRPPQVQHPGEGESQGGQDEGWPGGARQSLRAACDPSREALLPGAEGPLERGGWPGLVGAWRHLCLMVPVWAEASASEAGHGAHTQCSHVTLTAALRCRFVGEETEAQRGLVICQGRSGQWIQTQAFSCSAALPSWAPVSPTPEATWAGPWLPSVEASLFSLVLHLQALLPLQAFGFHWKEWGRGSF